MNEEAKEPTLSRALESAVEGSVISQSQADVIRQMHAEGVPKKGIARALELDIKTVRRAIKCVWKPQQRTRTSKIEPFSEFIQQRFEEVGYNAAVIDRELRALGYEGSYPVVARHVRGLRPRAAELEPVVRFETAPGRQAQVDWGMLTVWIGEEPVKVHFFTMVLGYSRRIFARAYLHERIGNLLDGFERAFEHFGGRTETVLLDNPRTVVLRKDEATGEVEWNRTFKDRMDFYGIEPKLCRYYRAQTKGKVERGVKYVKRNALAGKRFVSIDALNAWLEEWSLSIADERVHGTTHEIPRQRYERAERSAMIAIERRPPAGAGRTEVRVVDSDGTVVVATNRYPVPYGWIGVEARVTHDDERVEVEHAGETVAYERIRGRYRAAQWQGPSRTLQPNVRVAEAPPRFDPAYLAAVGQVEVRSLAQYAAEVEV